MKEDVLVHKDDGASGLRRAEDARSGVSASDYARAVRLLDEAIDDIAWLAREVGSQLPRDTAKRLRLLVLSYRQNASELPPPQ